MEKERVVKETIMARISAVGELARRLGGYQNAAALQHHCKEMARKYQELHPKSETFFFNDGSEQELLKRQSFDHKCRDPKSIGSANLTEAQPNMLSPRLSTFDVDFRVDEHQ